MAERRRHDEGSSILETALVMPVLFLLLAGAVDLGRGYYTALETESAAQAGALYGVQNPANIVGMVAAAKLDGSDLITMVPTATYGCECSDGTSAVPLCTAAPTCAYNVVNYVQVSTTAVYVPILIYPGLPKSIMLTGNARMRAAYW